ncbi:MAG: ABC transporter ATP-binding protein/permease [Solobacterium sp.]|jgi:ATP-binding cassette subfamily B protein|nr:ABC transporter ATP-binding protein/permease [Solobacterium sp.]MCH4223088.1 ABC transporter ATP-binding protein/permease [Solobacterium sp.]MCH4265682.1 ABC transporter ATP-binding protein/permease [Solobacterium sp.]
MEHFKRLFQTAPGAKRDYVIATIAVLLETCTELFIPFIMADVIDTGVANHDINAIINKGIEMLILTGISMIFGLIYARFMARAAMEFGAAVREAEFEAVQNYSFTDLDELSTSSLITRITSDTTVLQNAITGGLRPFNRGVAMCLLGVILCWRISPSLSVIFLVLTPALALILILILKKIAPMYRTIQKKVDRVNVIVQEDLRAIRAVKAFVREDYETAQFDEVNSDLAQVTEHTYHYAVMNMPAFQAAMYVTTVLLMWFGGNMILGGSLKVGQLTGILSYVMQIMNALMMVSSAFLLFARSLASASRVVEVLDHRPSMALIDSPVQTVETGSVDFEQVSFKYSASAKRNALSDINLHIEAGATAAVIGGTGSGKSTLVQLIPRLYDVSEGTVSVGGRNVRTYDPSALHDAVSMVLQNNQLFSGTVRENLKWGNPEAEDEELLQACRMACCDEFLDRIGGLDGVISQGGVNVSGGQKQRLCIARALLKHPKILIFDDSTSAVDTATERKIRQNLKAIDATKIIITQRVTSIMDADQIILMKNGMIQSSGTHEHLYRTSAEYRAVCDSLSEGGDSHAVQTEAA